MKKRIFNLILAAVAISGLLSSCAEEIVSNSDEIRKESLAEWMAINRPDMEKYGDGFYIKVYPNDASSDITTAKEYLSSDWLEITYSIQALNGNYSYNMYSAMSDTLGQFSYRTHFVPDRILAGNASYNLSQAQVTALAYMNPLDSVEVIADPDYFVSSGANFTSPTLGYAGNVGFNYSAPLHLKMRFNSLISDMYAYERNTVREYAKNEMGLSVADSVEGISMMYFEKLIDLPNADTIPSDTIVTVNYITQFTDGFVADTNIEEVAKANNIYAVTHDENTGLSTSYQPLSVTLSSDSSVESGVVTGFLEAIRMLKVGEKARVVITSNLAYGDNGTGAVGDGTMIQPKEPLVFTIEVIDEDDDE